MSAEHVRTIIDRAATDGEYRKLLLSDPDAALEGYALTDVEVANLKGIRREEFDAAAGTLEGRRSLKIALN